MASLTFATKLSHTADSQRQRQRRTPGATPPIEAAFDGTPDFITPKVIEENGDLQELYQKSLDQIYKNVKKALESGIDKEKALLLLPNAQAIRLYETGDFFDWLHRFKQRLCFVAQEEIFFISCDQVEQILEVLPQAKATLLAPCGIRKKAQISPKCPEGDRFCDQPVFNFEDIKNYKKARLI
jgi:thymidylate synthase ThyX